MNTKVTTIKMLFVLRNEKYELLDRQWYPF